MKTARLVIGILSIILFCVITFQSCVAGIGNALEENGEVSGSAGFLLAVCMLTAGIIGVAARRSNTAGIVAGAFYAFGGLIGICNYGSYKDLAVWAVISFGFAVVFILGGILAKRKAKTAAENKPDSPTDSKPE